MSLPSLSSLASDDGEEDGRRHHPAGVGRGALDRGNEATVLGTGGRLRRLEAIMGGEYARDDFRCDVGGEERERGSVAPPPVETIDSSLDLCKNFFAYK
jgi:hypothetical protein